MANVEDITPHIEIVGGDEAIEFFEHIGDVGAEAFAKITEQAMHGDFTALATLIGGRVAGAFTEAAHAIYEFVDAQAQSAETLSALAEASGMTIAQIEGVKDAFASVGITQSGFLRAMSRLSVTLARDWSQIEQSIRTSANSQENALLGVQQAALATQRAYQALEEASHQHAEQSYKDSQSIADARLNLQKTMLNQQKDLGGTDQSSVKQQEQILKIQEDQNAVQKARHAIQEANIKAVEDQEKAELDLKEKVLAVQKAQLAEVEAQEKLYEVSLKNIPAIAADIDAVVKGYKQWSDVANVADISTQNLGHALELAASGDVTGKNGPARALDMLKEMATLFPKMGDDSINLNQKMGILQRTMASMGGGGAGGSMGTPAQFLAVLDRGIDKFNEFQSLTEKFANSDIGLGKMANGMSPVVETLKEFNASWAELDAILDQVRGRLASVIGANLTAGMKSMLASITDTDGALHQMIEAAERGLSALMSVLTAVGRIISDIASAANQIVQYMAKMMGIDPSKIWMVVGAFILGAVEASRTFLLVLGQIMAKTEAWALLIGLVVTALGNVVAMYRMIHGASEQVANNNPLENIGKDILSAASGGLTNQIPGLQQNNQPGSGGGAGGGLGGAQDVGEQLQEPAQQLGTAGESLGGAGETLGGAAGDLSQAADKLSQAADVRQQLQNAGYDQPEMTIVGQAGGGYIRGPGGPTDDRAGLFALSDGEFVMRSAAVQHYGTSLFHALNDLAVGGFAAGGLVSTVARPASAAGGHQQSSILNLSIDGHKFNGLRAPADVASKLKSYAVTRQNSAAGRNPSWMR